MTAFDELIARLHTTPMCGGTSRGENQCPPLYRRMMIQLLVGTCG